MYVVRIMKPVIYLALFSALAAAAFAQQAVTTNPPAAPPSTEMPTDPRAIFAAAAPYYNFNDSSLKPWHLKATYQLYDAEGKPGELGTYEYWWASPDVYRSTWSRPSATRTEWRLAENQVADSSTGGPLEYFELKLRSALFSPLPKPEELNAPGVHLQVDERKIFTNGEKSPCIMVVPYMAAQTPAVQTAPSGLFPTYCFDPGRPILRAETSFGTLAMQFNSFVQIQGRFLPRKIDIFEGKRQILSATVAATGGISPSDPALTPPTEVKVIKYSAAPAGGAITSIDRVNLSSGLAVGMLLTKVQPVYPVDAKEAHVSGTVVLQAVIGRDGSLQDLRIMQAPSASLAASALIAVSQWKYRPYLLNGNPVEVDTTINVIYTLGR
jgi:TonB family protein